MTERRAKPVAAASCGWYPHAPSWVELFRLQAVFNFYLDTFSRRIFSVACENRVRTSGCMDVSTRR